MIQLSVEDKIKKARSQGKIAIGAKSSLKALRTSSAEEVVLARNCPEELSGDLKMLAELSGAALHESDKDSQELGALCKKSFPCAVLTITK